MPEINYTFSEDSDVQICGDGGISKTIKGEVI